MSKLFDLAKAIGKQIEGNHGQRIFRTVTVGKGAFLVLNQL